MVGNDSFVIQRIQDNILQVLLYQTQYGVMHNGIKIKNTVELKSYDFLMLAGYYFYYYEGFLYTCQYESMRVNRLEVIPVEESNNAFQYPYFNCSTRLKVKIPEEKINILDPKPPKEKTKKSIFIMLAPVFMSLLFMILFRVVLRGGSGGTFIYYSLAMMIMGAVFTVINLITDKKRDKKEEVKRVSDYQKYIEEKEAYILDMRELEKECMEEKYTSLVTIVIPLIDACLGVDIITGEDLSDFERGMKGVFAAVHAVTLMIGFKASGIAKVVGKESLKFAGKTITINIASNGVAYVLGKAGEEMDLPLPLTLLMSFAGGSITSTKLGNYAFKNSAGIDLLNVDKNVVDDLVEHLDDVDGIAYKDFRVDDFVKSSANFDSNMLEVIDRLLGK